MQQDADGSGPDLLEGYLDYAFIGRRLQFRHGVWSVSSIVVL